MFIIWQSTIRQDADLSPFTIGVRVSGRNADDFRVSISDQGMSYEPGTVEDCLRCWSSTPAAWFHRFRPG